MRGTYTLVMKCQRHIQLSIGKLGRTVIERSLLVYTGSALGRGGMSLEHRLKRHFRPAKKIRWHIDYLTSRKDLDILSAVYTKSTKRLECPVNQAILDKLNARSLLLGAGSSDCKCPGHILVFPRGLSLQAALREIQRIYSSLE